MSEHVILVAITVEAATRQAAHETVMAALPQPEDLSDVAITSWWVAEDDRWDGSDNDSAVFCEKGWQRSAFNVLRHHSLSAEHNDPEHRP